MPRLMLVVAERPSREPKADIIRLLLYTGCRRSEIQNLRWKEVGDGLLDLSDSKTGPRHVFLNRAARTIIDRQPRSGSPYVFPSPSDPARPRPSILAFWHLVRGRSAIDEGGGVVQDWESIGNQLGIIRDQIRAQTSPTSGNSRIQMDDCNYMSNRKYKVQVCTPKRNPGGMRFVRFRKTYEPGGREFESLRARQISDNSSLATCGSKLSGRVETSSIE